MAKQSTSSPMAPLLRDVKILTKIESAKYGSIDVPRLVQENDIPRPSWTKGWEDERGRRFPNAIAHRGFQKLHPENSMAAFRGAIKVGAHALETDIHLSRDDVVVLSHDGDLKRCFGVNKKIVDCDWDYLRTLKSTRAPGEPLATLQQLLEYLALPEQKDIWILLDIKIDNDGDKVMQLIAKTIASVTPGDRPWKDRILLGCWLAKYVPLCLTYLPGFPITHIGVSTVYARQFLAVPNCSFNMGQRVLFGPIGSRFLKTVKENNREIFVWTVNESNLMKWCIQKEFDGVITDDPQRFKEICRSWRDDEPPAHPTWSQWIDTLWLYIAIAVIRIFIYTKYPETVQQYLAKKGSPQHATEAKIQLIET